MSLSIEIAQLADQLESKERELAKRELVVAQAIEQLSEDPQVKQAFNAGKDDERHRVAALIDMQLETLGRAGLNAISLRTLRSRLWESKS